MLEALRVVHPNSVALQVPREILLQEMASSEPVLAATQSKLDFLPAEAVEPSIPLSESAPAPNFVF